MDKHQRGEEEEYSQEFEEIVAEAGSKIAEISDND